MASFVFVRAIAAVVVSNAAHFVVSAATMPERMGMVILPCIFLFIWLTVIIFIVVMVLRLVRAVEKVADAMEKGVPVKKQE